MTDARRTTKQALIVAGIVALSAAGVFLRFRLDFLSGLSLGIGLGLLVLGFRPSREA